MDTALVESRFAALLKDLIKMKDQRDPDGFTAARLANKLGVSRSIVQRILTGDVSNPRLDTVQKICQFFSDDGFPINLDSILIENKTQQITQVPLFLSDNPNNSIGLVNHDCSEYNANLIAFASSVDISSLLKKGSVFIVDTNKAPVDENIVAINQDEHVAFWKYSAQGNKKYLLSLQDNDTTKIILSKNITLVGVVTRINAKL